MNKSELIDALAARYEGNRKQAAHALESVLDTITREVAKGEKVAITGFGSFEKAVRNARWVRNPQTGERMKSKKKAVPKFSAGKELKDVISGAKKLPKLTAATMPKPPGVRAAAAAVTGATAKKSAPAKSTATRSTAAKKSSTAKSAPAKSTAAKKSTAKKTSTSTASKAAAKKTPAKKTATKSTAAKSTAAKSTASKTTASKSTAKKAPAKKAPAKKSTAKKATAKKTAKKS